ncbi:MAG TPA: DUF3488 and transglutaminase-like domain-containing protein [Acidimicrobiia bacterium]|nr:DUF3488 and transglutaminase-like domain-containing protein [Acidimicrobiia bacterium]
MERSRLVSIALLGLTAATVVNARHIVDFSFIQICVLIAVAAGAHICALLCSSHRRLHPVSPLISFFILLVFLLVTNAHGALSRMIPNRDNLGDLVHDSRQGVLALRTGELPFSYSVKILLVALVLTWVIAEIAETLAQRLHSSAPTLLWFITINAYIAAQKDAPSLTFAIVTIAGGAWFFLYSFERAHEHARSHVVPLDPSLHRTNAFIYFGTFCAVAITGLLLVLPISNVPSWSPKTDFNFLDSYSSQTELSPLVSMKQQLKEPNNDVLFTATAPEALYWRVAVLDDFDGDTWSLDSPTKQKPEILLSGIEGRKLKGTVQLTKLASKFLPTFYSTQSLSTRDITFLQHSVVSSKKSSLRQYSFTALVPPATLTPEQIKQSSDDAPQSVETSALLPVDFDAAIIVQAQKIAQGRGSIYEQVIALRDFFLDGSFVYDLDVNYSSSTRAMQQFLIDRRGFCEQFATTYAAMARSIGIPARVVIGFTPGEPDAKGRFVITSKQAHSWVEVYLSNFGWLTIDPTPAGDLPGQAPTNIGAVVTTTTTSATTAPVNTAQPGTTATTGTTQPQQNMTSNTKENSQSSSLVVILMSMLILGGAGAFLEIRRRRRLSPKNDEQYVLQTFKEISERVLSGNPQPDLTIAELVEHVPESNEIIREFLALLTLASYAPSSIPLRDLREAATKARAEPISVDK